MPKTPHPRTVLILTAVLLSLPSAAAAATFFVDSLADSGPGSLRQALFDANFTEGVDTVLFSAGVTGTILLESGLPRIGESVDIIGPAAEALTIDVQGNDRVLEFSGDPGEFFGLQGLTLTGGQPSGGGGGGGLGFFGGRLLLEGVHVVMNSTGPSASGGGLFAASGTEVEIYRSIFAGNVATGSGGAISGDIVTVSESSIYGNTASFGGGGVSASGRLSFFESTLSGNEATSNSTPASGGGLSFAGELVMYSTTVTDNIADLGPGIARGSSGATVLEFGGNIVAGNRLPGGAERNCDGVLGIEGFNNLSGDASCGFTGAGDLENTDPDLEPLAPAGGPTPTHVPRLGSPAIDASLNSFCIAVDQRGFPRPVDADGDGNALCDIGAVEFTPDFDGLIFGDGFESGDFAAWSNVVE